MIVKMETGINMFYFSTAKWVLYWSIIWSFQGQGHDRSKVMTYAYIKRCSDMFYVKKIQ
jgi:hypothetical protein